MYLCVSATAIIWRIWSAHTQHVGQVAATTKHGDDAAACPMAQALCPHRCTSLLFARRAWFLAQPRADVYTNLDQPYLQSDSSFAEQGFLGWETGELRHCLGCTHIAESLRYIYNSSLYCVT